MIPSSCKRLIEVDFPIGVVSEHSAREKSIRHGHPSTLHLWWARRPLAACRAVLLGLLLPDPCDKDCPSDFRTRAWDLLSEDTPADSTPKVYEVQARRLGEADRTDLQLRNLLLQFMGELSNWDNASNATFLRVARGLVKAAHPEETPVVVDPFAGGGSIPLEALRLGCEAFASDLNPVACLILKTLLEDIPKYGSADFKLNDDEGTEVVVHGLANALRHVGAQVKKAAEKELAQFYPRDPDGSRPIAYLWARTVRCEAVGCGAGIPLVRSFWLSRKAGRRRALRYRIDREGGVSPAVAFEVFEPRSEGEVPAGTVRRADATCPCCCTVLPAERVRAQIADEHGGADTLTDGHGRWRSGAVLLAVVTIREGIAGRSYRTATETDLAAIRAAMQALQSFPDQAVPDEPLPPIGTLGFRVQRYGVLTWGDLFSSRQKLSLVTLQRLLGASRAPDNVKPLLAAAFNRVAMSNMSLTRWNAHAEKMQHTFGRQALPIVWDFAEVVPTADAPGNWQSGYELNCDVAGMWPPGGAAGQVQQADARLSPLGPQAASVWFTDPPYYDAVPYSDLSDFFFVWLKRTLPAYRLAPDPYDPSNPLTPKVHEIVQDRTRRFSEGVKDAAFFEREMATVFGTGRRVVRDDGVACVVFAHKTTEGWEALLSGMLRSGWTVTASWPIATEMGSRLRAQDSAALATSVHLVCRPRPADAGAGDWGQVKAAMEKRIREWLPTLTKHGVRGADAVFSCLGPALESYSRYDKVLTAADQDVPLGGDPDATEPHKRGFLAYVFEAVSKEALRQVLGDADTEGFEEDARLTALFLWTLQATKANGGGQRHEAREDSDEGDDEDGAKPRKAKAGLSMPFDTFIRITRPMGIHYPDLEGRVIDIDKGIVRLLPVRERSEQILGEAATRPEVEISLKDARQLELGLVIDQPKTAAPLPTGRTRGRKMTAAGQPTGTETPFTTLDRIHRAMLLFSLGRALLLRQVLEEEIRQGKRFERLALALNALYPDGADERRMLEGVQASMRGAKA
jgi:putative DNA methylase